MKYLGRFAHPDLWKDDETKLGYIYVKIDGQVVAARPHQEMGRLWVPSKEFIVLYGDYLWVLLDKVEDQEYLIWTGIATVGQLPQSLSSDQDFQYYVDRYPYYRFQFTENWRTATDDTKDKNSFRISHVDGTQILIDRTKDQEVLELFDPVLGNLFKMDRDATTIYDGVRKSTFKFTKDGISIVDGPTGSRIDLTKEGMTLFDGSGQTTIVDGSNKIEISADSLMSLLSKTITLVGNTTLGASNKDGSTAGSEPVPMGNVLVDILTNIIDHCETHTHLVPGVMGGGAIAKSQPTISKLVGARTNVKSKLKSKRTRTF